MGTISFRFPRRGDSAIAGLEEAKNPAGKSPPPDSDPFNDAEFGGKSRRLSSKLASANTRFEFQKSRQLFIRSHNETLSIVAMRVCNPDRVRPLESIAETQPQLQTALIIL